MAAVTKLSEFYLHWGSMIVEGEPIEHVATAARMSDSYKRVPEIASLVSQSSKAWQDSRDRCDYV